MMPREWKRKDVDEMKEMIEEHGVVGVLNMHQLPAPQLQEMRKDLYRKAKIRMSRKTLMKIAIDETGKENIEDLKEHLQGESAFIFTDMNPFKLYNYLQENKSSAPAKAGDIAPNDIVVNEGSTGIDPGPAIGKLQSAGLKTSIEEGKIHINEESVLVGDGEEVTPEDAEALQMLDMEPMEVGLNLKALIEEGAVFEPGDLELNVEKYRESVEDSYRRGLGLAIELGYVTEESAPLVIREARRKAEALAVALDYPIKDVIDRQLLKSLSEGKALKSKVEDLGTDGSQT